MHPGIVMEWGIKDRKKRWEAGESETERALRDSEERLRFVFEDNPTMFFIVDEEGTIESVNRYGAEYLGYTCEELAGKSVLTVVHPEDHELVQEHLAQCIRTPGQVCHWEFRKVRKDGSILWVRELARPMRNATDGKIAVLIVCEDITDGKHAGETQSFLFEASTVLASSLDYERTLRAVARLAVPAIADWCVINLVDAHGNMERVDVTHRDPEKEAFARSVPMGARNLGSAGLVPEVIRTGKSVLKRDISLDELARLAGDEELFELARKLGTGSAIVVPLRARGRVLGSITLVVSGRSYDEKDLTLATNLADRAALAVDNATLYRESERRTNEERELRQELERVTESRTRLMRGFSHDLKNPLSVADGYAQVLEQGMMGDLSDRQLERVHRIRRSIHSSLDLIDKLLELARAEAGQITLELAPTNVAAVLREVAQDAQTRANEAGLTLHIDAPASLHCETDSNRVRQVLGNLTSNAVKYGERGEVALTVETTRAGPAGQPGEWIALHVADNGPGIPEEKRERVFQEFTRLDPTAPGGTGLGLAISRRIARLLGGDITLESTPGHGSTFTLWLPHK